MRAANEIHFCEFKKQQQQSQSHQQQQQPTHCWMTTKWRGEIVRNQWLVTPKKTDTHTHFTSSFSRLFLLSVETTFVACFFFSENIWFWLLFLILTERTSTCCQSNSNRVGLISFQKFIKLIRLDGKIDVRFCWFNCFNSIHDTSYHRYSWWIKWQPEF